MSRGLRSILVVTGVLATMLVPNLAHATPVCTDGYEGGPPLAVCGGRIFPEAALARAYIQQSADPTGFKEFEHGIKYLALKYPRWISVMSFRDLYGDDAVSVGPDKRRSYTETDTNDGRDIWVIKITDHEVPDDQKKALLFSLSVHGNERGGLEGGARTAEDLAIAATRGAANLPGSYISDGVPGYHSTTGKVPEFHSYRVDQVLKKQAVYMVDYNMDGWAYGDTFNNSGDRGVYNRGNGLNTDLNRQMPTVGRINPSRNPLQESEMYFGHKHMHELAEQSGGLMAHGADIHGELTSRAYVDIMYPAGEFDSVEHRRLMSIAERVKSVVDDTLYLGIQNEIEEAMGGDGHEGIEETVPGTPKNTIPTKPAHWATVWDTLGYTDTGFIGDYLATDVAVTGMDYEIFLNHTVPERVWNVYLQENHINMVRAAVKTSMAYALTQEEEFNADNVRIDTGGNVGYVYNPDTVTDSDEDGVGTGPTTEGEQIGLDPNPVTQKPYEVSNMKWFEDTDSLLSSPFVKLTSGQVASNPAALDQVDTIVLADVALPQDADGGTVDPAAYYANLKAWVAKGGNLVLTDRALHALGGLGLVDPAAVRDVTVYQPYANIRDFDHEMVEGLRRNARQLVEAAALGYGIGNNASPMTIVDKAVWEAAGGHTVATTGNNSGDTDSLTQTSIGELAHGDGKIRIVGGALPTPTETQDHRYGLRNYALTYSGLYVMENSIQHDSPALGTAPAGASYTPVAIVLALMFVTALAFKLDLRRLVGVKR
jgi:hypothetical protein